MIDRRNVANLYGLTPLQEGILYHALRDPASRAYFERLEYGLDGALDAAAFRAAWQDLTDRHDILRTLFAVRNTPRPLQVVLRQWPVVLHEEDLSALSASEARARIEAWKAGDLERGFRLAAEVPLRLALFRLDAGHHRVVWSFHHILLDGWCLAILQHEFDACYLARLDGRPPRLPAAPRFASYVRWLDARDRHADSAFWAQRLAGFDTPTPVPPRLAARFAAPTDEPGTTSRREHVHALAADSARALEQQARSLATTPSSVVQALWGLLLAGLNGTHDAIFAATVSGRPVELPGAEATVGLFINAVPVRVRFAAGDTLGTLVQRIHEEGIAARAHHAMPLPDVQAAHPLRERLIDHVLVFENYPAHDTPADPRLPRARTDDADLHEYTHYGFEFQFLPQGETDGARLRFRFDPRRHDPGAVARLGERLEALLRLPSTTRCDDALAALLPGWRGPRRVALAASFTVEPVAEAMRAWLRQFGQPAGVELAPYNQCPRALLDPDGALASAELAFLLYHPEDALRDLEAGAAGASGAAFDPAGADGARLRARHQALLDAFAHWCADATRPPLVVALLPDLHASAGDGPLAELLRELATDWATRVAQAASSRVVALDLRDPRTATALPPAAWPDTEALHLGHVPYSDAGCAALGAALARPVLARARAPFKVIAIDCDNTLWDGICGEAGPLGVRIGPARRALQDFLVARQEEGFLLVLASKNVELDVWAVFDQNPDMVLRREHITAAAINWQPKPGNLRTLAHQLNLGLDSLLFLDDNPAEIAAVMHECPEVLALALPGDAERLADWLPLLWACDLPAVTAEDRERTRMMQAEATRQEVLARTRDVDEFLAGIDLRLAIGPMAPHQLARVAQLTQRTNQFNLSGKRRSEAEVAALAAREDTVVLAVEVEDRFGAYGLTGVVIACRDDAHGEGEAVLTVDSLLLSCRVLGRRVEQGILCALARIAAGWGCTRILAPLVPTERNDPVRQFLAGPPWREEADHRFVCEIAAALPDVRGITLSEGHVFQPPAPAAPLAPRAPGSCGAPTAAPDGAERPLPLPLACAIENEARLVHAVQMLPQLAAASGWPGIVPPALQAHRAGGRVVTDDAREPLPGTESTVAAIWADVLQLDAVPAETPFADLGGHSLHAVRVVSRLERAFATRIGLAQFYALGTVAALAGWLEAHPAAGERAALPPIPRLPAPDDAGDVPLSHSQYRVWLLSRLGAAEAAYNQCAAWRLCGPLDVAALARAVDCVVARHEALRTVFPLAAEGPRQKVLDHVPLRLEIETARGQSVDAVARRVASAGRRPFDLEHGPLARFMLIECAPEEHVLAIAMHHVIGDGWSFGLLLADLVEAWRSGTLPPAPALRYRDYAAWTRSPAFSAALAPHRDYWRARLGTAGTLPALPAIPSDRARPPQASGRGDALRRTIPLAGGAREHLDRLLAAHGASLFQFLAALVMTLIARHAPPSPDDGGTSRIPVRLGTPVAGRDRAELEETAGIFVNTVVLDAAVEPSRPFTELLTQVRDGALAALDHQHYPFDRLVEDLAPERDPGRNPLFDVLVALQNAPRRADGLPGLTVEDLPVPLGVSAFDLVFEFAPVDAGLALELSWATDLYDAASAKRLADRFETLLAAALADPGQPLAALPLIGTHEAQRLAAFTCGPARPLPQDTLPQRFERTARSRPRSPALLCEDETLDFATLAARVERLALGLATHGVGRGERVAVLLPRAACWPVALLAVLRAGAVYLPLEPRHPPARLRELLADARPALLLTDAAAVDTLGPELPCRWLDVDTATPCIPPSGEFPALPDPAPDDVAYLLYTSGSTGTPKGVEVSHRAFLNMIDAQIEGFEVSDGDVVLQFASSAFDASLSEFFLGWLAGVPVALADAQAIADAGHLGAFLRHHRVTLATFTPSYLRHLEDADLAGLERVILAGEAVYGRDVSRLLALGLVVYNAYGPTETAVCATLGRIAAAPADEAPVPIGRPLANLQIVLRDAHGQTVPIGLAGELCVFGAGVARGYWQRPDLEAGRFVVDPALGRGYRTGDLARWRDDGELEYLGRSDDQLKLRGQRLEPGEIVARLLAQPGVRQAAVTLEAGPAGAVLSAWISPAQTATAALREALAGQLPAYMVPERWIALDDLPLTTSGKLDRRRLGALPPTLETPPSNAAAEPLSPFGQRLLALWQTLLGPRIGPDSDFFASGGNSLLAMQAARRIATELGQPCPPIRIFRHPSVRALAAALEQEAPRGGHWNHWGRADAPLLIALPPAPGIGAVYAQLAAQLGEFALRAPDVDERPLAHQLEQWADELAADARPAPVLLGASGGGRLALALADLLCLRGRPPRAVILVDTWRWDPHDPRLAPVLAELHRRAAQDDQALAEATGLSDADTHTDLAARGQRYRRAVDALASPEALPVPLVHFIADVDPASIPQGFSRDWSDCTCAGYRSQPLAGGHTALLCGPELVPNAAQLRALLHFLVSARQAETALPG